ncbi:MAG: hypothetical protein LC780_13075 [Acidobacteria bacterium]|nr:hypothetical protein [Acidobacteriota bacterium]
MARRLDFARRPFRDERPFLLLAAVAFGLAAILLVANVRQYASFSGGSSGSCRRTSA